MFSLIVRGTIWFYEIECYYIELNINRIIINNEYIIRKLDHTSLRWYVRMVVVRNVLSIEANIYERYHN